MNAASFQHPGGGRSNRIEPGYISPLSYNSTPRLASPVGSHKKSALFTQTKSLGHDSRSGSPISQRSQKAQPHSLRPTLRSIDTNMGSYTTTQTLSAPSVARTDSRHRLHKRGSSGSSLPGSPAIVLGTTSQFTTPTTTAEEPFPDLPDITPSSSTPKLGSYLRKISTAKDDPDQGRLDLSKSVSENEALAGLGIQDFASRSTPDMPFAPIGRRTPHTRTTSVGSQVSTGSGSARLNQPFVHPMRQVPNRAYTPTLLDAESLNDEEARESSDIVTDEDVPRPGIRSNRSMSISSTPQINPTPLSQSQTIADLGEVPKLTSSSQTNLSIRSARSMKSLKSKLGRSRTNTNRSAEFLANTPSSRTSIDKAFSMVSRRSNPDPLTRDERIRAERRKFEAKEANKDRKMDNQAFKRHESDMAKDYKKQERQRRKSEASERSRVHKSNSRKMTKASEKESLEITALPPPSIGYGRARRAPDNESHSSKRGGSRFSAFMRSLNCGKSDS